MFSGLRLARDADPIDVQAGAGTALRQQIS
jgi:hypothetical protein